MPVLARLFKAGFFVFGRNLPDFMPVKEVCPIAGIAACSRPGFNIN